MSDCPCDTLTHPSRGSYGAGLSHIPRQWAGFSDYRAAMLAEVRRHPALAQWRARATDDLGVMLVEMFAYVLDVVGFYDAFVANRSYLRTAALPASVSRLVDLVGYRPRPAIAAEALLAVTVEPGAIVPVPAGSAFRSSGDGGVAPQVFTAVADSQLHASKNEWTLAEQRLPFSRELLLDSASVSLGEGELIVFEEKSRLPRAVSPPSVAVGGFARPGSSAAESAETKGPRPQPVPPLMAARVLSLEAAIGPDGQRYTRLELPPLGRQRWHGFAEGRVKKPSQTAPIEFVRRETIWGTQQKHYDMDAVYVGIHQGDRVIVESATRELGVAIVEQVGRAGKALGNDITVPITTLRLRGASGEIPANVGTLHFRLVDSARLARPRKTDLSGADLSGSVPLRPPLAPIHGGQPDRFVLAGKEGTGVLVSAALAGSPGLPVLRVANTPTLDQPLRTPIRAFANLIDVVRGEAVAEEVLGSGDAGVGFQSFVLEKKPLTYVRDPGAASMRRSTLRIWVDGVRWLEAASFIEAGPDDPVYVVRHDYEERTTVTFGDGLHGQRLPTGIDNIIASYRFGAGAEKPAAGTLTQSVDPPAGLRSVLNPTAAFGGADADRPEDIRRNAARSALTLGRAVSVDDVEALARDFGVVNAAARPHWSAEEQRVVIQVWVISDGASVADSLQRALSQQTGPETPISVAEAIGDAARIRLELVTDSRHDRAEVLAAARDALLGSGRGLLDPSTITIGFGLFRSALIDAVQRVAGVVQVRSLSFNGRAMAPVEGVEPGHYISAIVELNALNAVERS